VNLPLEAETGAITLFPVPSTWTSIEGSILTIENIEDQTHKITRYFITKAEDYPCKNIPYPVTGWLYGSILTFSVMWKDQKESCGAVTTWIGYIEQNRITAVWKLIDHNMVDLSETFESTDYFEVNTEIKSDHDIETE